MTILIAYLAVFAGLVVVTFAMDVLTGEDPDFATAMRLLFLVAIWPVMLLVLVGVVLGKFLEYVGGR